MNEKCAATFLSFFDKIDELTPSSIGGVERGTWLLTGSLTSDLHDLKLTSAYLS